MKAVALLLLACSASSPVFAADSEHTVKTAVYPPTQATIVVAEGDMEPRSIGSYGIRLYAKNDPAFPYDHFVAGLVRPRDGSIESIRFADIDHDGTPEVIVVMRSTGSGGYQSAEAFHVDAKSLRWMKSVNGLEANADPVRALAASRKITN
jgi:hypothetical protein